MYGVHGYRPSPPPQTLNKYASLNFQDSRFPDFTIISPFPLSPSPLSHLLLAMASPLRVVLLRRLLLRVELLPTSVVKVPPMPLARPTPTPVPASVLSRLLSSLIAGYFQHHTPV